MTKFSIIIPVYNVAKYLDECLRSVLEQSYTNFEVILVDDGSTDESGAICDRYAEKDERIVVVHKANGGLSSARNEALRHYTGDYTIYLDSDDYLLECDILQRIADRIEITRPDVLIYNLQKMYEGVLSAPYFSEDIQAPLEMTATESKKFVFENDLWTASACNKVIKTDLYKDDTLRFRLGITSEDVDWCLRLALAAERFDFINLNVFAYRQRQSSISGTMTVKKMRCLLDNILYCLDLLTEAEPSKRELLKGYVSYQYGTLLYSFSSLPRSIDKRRLYAEIKKLEYLLEWARNSKVMLIRRAKKVFGLRLTIVLLSVKVRLTMLRSKRRD